MAWAFVLDGVDVTSVAFDKQVTRRLNLPWTASCRIPSKLVGSGVAEGSSRLKVYDDSSAIYFHGIVWTMEDQGDENTCYTRILAADPMVLWPRRPARDADGDFSFPSFWTTQSTGPAIMKYLLDNSATWEGQLFVDTGGTIAAGGVDLSGTPVDYPMTIADVWEAIAATGVCDLVLQPVDSTPSIVQLSAYNGDYGSDLSGSVVFQYATGAHNVRTLRRFRDMTDMVNKLYYFGPNITTLTTGATDPQHFQWNVTGDNPLLANPPGGDVDYPNPLGDLINASRAAYWVSMDVQIHDDATPGNDSATSPAPELALRRWQGEIQSKVNPRELVHFTPVRGLEPSFTPGDLVTIEAGSLVRGGFTGKQRVYELTVQIDNDGVTEIGEIVASADQES